MTSYSKVFKASNISLHHEVKVLPSVPSQRKEEDSAANPLEEDHKAEEFHREARQILDEAQRYAEQILQEAREKAADLESTTREKMDSWWAENQKKIEDLSVEAQQKGYQDGFEKGKEMGLQEAQKEYEGKLKQVQSLLLQAYDEKEAIIAEAEPFLLELSSVIASQILRQELHSYPDKFIELIKHQIRRVKEKKSITICVHPDDFEFVQEQRTHLLAVVGGETEIKIIPDHSVPSSGCILRTAYGSIDARIDTQMEEIKKVILDVRREQETENDLIR